MNQTSNFQKLDQSIQGFVDSCQHTHYEFFDMSIFQKLLKQLKYNTDGYCPEFLYSLVSKGVFPMSMYNQLYPKLHKQRCMIKLDDWNFNLHDKNLLIYNAILRKKLKNVAKRIYKEKQDNKYQYLLKINQNHEEIFQFCKKNIFSFWINNNYAKNITQQSKQVYQFNNQKFQFLVIGLYQKDIEKNQTKLVATEIGYRYGTVYVSMSGCYDRKFCNFGNLSLFSLGMLLKQKKYKIWDLGMIMTYKLQMGGKSFQRVDLLNIYKSIQNNPEDFNDQYYLHEIEGFWLLVQQIEEERQQNQKKFQIDKFSKRLPKDLKTIEKNVRVEDWNTDYVQKWCRIKIRQDLPEINGQQLIEFINDDFDKSMSKKKFKKLKKLITKLCKKDQLIKYKNQHQTLN